MIRWMTILVLVLACAGCGSESSDPEPTPIPPSAVNAFPVDCTPSVRGDQKTWANQIAHLASDALARGERVLVGCFYGMKQGVDWLPIYDPATLPRVTGGAKGQSDYARRYGRSLAPVFERALVPHKERGTNWLGALRTSSRVAQVRVVHLFTDLVQQTREVDLTKPVRKKQMAELVEVWSDDLTGLEGTRVIVVGSGEGVLRSPAARRGEQLLDAVSGRVGFTVTYESVAG